MQTINMITDTEEVSIAQIEGDYTDPIRRFIFSTPSTCDIVNKPELMGVAYTEALEKGMTSFLRGFKDQMPPGIHEQDVNVLNFLRGGLNFGIRNALQLAYGWNLHGSTFISSQRNKDEDGRWYVSEDSYRKSTMGRGSVVFCGDVVATGVTLDSGLQTLTKILEESDASIRHLVFFTIGCHKTEKILEKYFAIWKERFEDFEGIDVVYIEGKFHLADSKTSTTIKLQGTDLLRRESLLMPAFIAHQEQNVRYALERCTIYDAGSRAFDVAEYKEDVHQYWTEVQKLAADGMTTTQYLEERYPEASDSLKAKAKEVSLTEIAEEKVAFFT